MDDLIGVAEDVEECKTVHERVSVRACVFYIYSPAFTPVLSEQELSSPFRNLPFKIDYILENI